MAFEKGDVLLAPFPFSDLSTSKVRPASEPDLILAAITSQLSAAAH